jgi:hypothetical protein
MTIEQLAAVVLDACEQEGVEHMLTGAFAHGLYGIPRSTKDIDVVLRPFLMSIFVYRLGEITLRPQRGARNFGYINDHV